MELSNETVLVTGAEGFIGSHLVEELVARGCKVRPFVLYNSFSSWGWLDTLPEAVRQQLDVRSGDVRDAATLTDAMRGCSVVLHLAALIAIPYSYKAPMSYVETNVGGTLNVLQVATELGARRVVHTSTSEVYGTARFVPITEEHPLNGQSPYAASKIGADQMAIAFHNSFGTPVSTLRPFNTYGPRQSARAVIPTIITQIASGQSVIRLGAEHPTRDFNFVKDVVQAFIAVAEADSAIGKVVNAGSNFEVSIGETARLIGELMGVAVQIQTDSDRVRPAESEVERLWADNSRIRDLTGWQPKHGGRDGFIEGLRKTIAWFTEPRNLAMYKAERYNV
jgi:NAD dependent epimerase/dehydratase